jgi:hypothetical protein
MDQPIPILEGIYTDGSDVRVQLPVNREPTPKQGAATDDYLRPVEGIDAFATGSGNDRAGIVWTGEGNGVHYRVSGTKLISITSAGVKTVIGDVGGSGHARLDFSFDLLGILSNGKLYYYDGATLAQVTDPNIPANLVDMVHVDGYWVVTDGTDIAVSDLATPTTFNPLRFGGTDRPNPIKALKKVVNELTAVSENYIDTFRNIGGSGFPFQRILSAVITRGAIGTRAACVTENRIAFLGGGREEEPSVYLGGNAQTVKIASMEVDAILNEYTTAQLATVTMETQVARGMNRIFVHLPDRSLVYDIVMSAKMGYPMWHIRTSAIEGYSQLRAQNYVRAHDQWIAGDPASTAIGVTTTESSKHYGEATRWEVVTAALRAGTKGVTMNRLELLAITGDVPFDVEPRVSVEYSFDGQGYSMPRSIPCGIRGETLKKLEWRKLGTWKRFRTLRFRGDSDSRISLLSLDADMTVLNW